MKHIWPLAAAMVAIPAIWVTLSPLASRGESANDQFRPTLQSAATPTGPAPAGMVLVPGGEFSMGCEDPTGNLCGGHETMNDARPIHRVFVDAFWMDQTDVINEQFARFVQATGYVTMAEQKPRAGGFPGVPADALVPGALVFTPPGQPVALDDFRQWWRYVPGANWRHPLGPASDLAGGERLPVVQVAYADALAYARWAKKRLPTEAQWEFAARGGLTGQPYCWGLELKPDGRWMANIWQGSFPFANTAEDGYAGVAPVAQYPPNGYGLYDMAGNVWQWCADWYRPDYYRQCVPEYGPARNPPGPASGEDPAGPDTARRVQRGGSFLCAKSYCARYIVGSRGKGDPDTGSNHVGFRCVRDLR